MLVPAAEVARVADAAQQSFGLETQGSVTLVGLGLTAHKVPCFAECVLDSLVHHFIQKGFRPCLGSIVSQAPFAPRPSGCPVLPLLFL